MTNLILLGVLGFVVFITIMSYNRLVSLSVSRKNAFSNIDVQLKLRHDLLPNLIETVRGYAKHEQTVFEEVTKARSRAMGANGDGQDRAQAEAALNQSLMKLMMVTENYPELKADMRFQQLQDELTDIENKIAATRRYFNGSTAEMNAYLGQFPAVVVAQLFGFKEQNFLEFDEAERKAMAVAPKVSFS